MTFSFLHLDLSLLKTKGHMKKGEEKVKDIQAVEGSRGLLHSHNTTLSSLHKVVRALYFIARNIKDKNISSSLRSIASSLLHTSYSFLREEDSKENKSVLYKDILLTLDEIFIFLQILFEEEILTSTQRMLFERELARLKESLGEGKGKTENILPSPLDMSFLFEEKRPKEKGLIVEGREKSTSSLKKEKKLTPIRKDSLKKEERKKLILQQLRAQGEQSLPEIAKTFPSASQKTIQRDLRELISQGIIEKEGERRWARYRVLD